nr:MAG TPA: hypothetical protein [Caudoviricetes sp.]
MQSWEEKGVVSRRIFYDDILKRHHEDLIRYHKNNVL